MASDWFETTIGEQVVLQRGIDITRAEQRPGEVPVVSSGGISSYHDTVAVLGPGVVLGRKGVLGSVYYLESDFWPHDTTLWVKDFRGNDPRFVYYFFRSISPQLQLLDVGSANPTLNRNHVHPIPTIWPRLKVQKAIAGALAAFDHRIDNLRQTNATLEAIAQALFKSWFVDFDPVRAKAEGREPESMDPITAALFPSEFEDSELSQIPKGWELDEIGKLVDCLGGATPSTKNETFWDGGVHHWATPKDLSGLGSPVLMDTGRKLTDAGVAKISSGLLPAGTLLMSSRAPIGYLAIAAMPVAVNQGFIAMPPGGRLSPTFLLFWCQANMELIEQSANGSTFMEISKKAFRPLPVLVPPPELLVAFESIVGPLIARTMENERHRLCLEETRDTLLPRLISGHLRLPEIEGVVEDVSA